MAGFSCVHRVIQPLRETAEDASDKADAPNQTAGDGKNCSGGRTVDGKKNGGARTWGVQRAALKKEVMHPEANSASNLPQSKKPSYSLGSRALQHYRFEGSVFVHACPKCHAPAWSWCLSRKGKPVRTPHAERSQPLRVRTLDCTGHLRGEPDED